MSETKENLKKAMCDYKSAIAKMKEEAIAFIQAIPEDSTKRMSDSPSVFTVTFATMKENGFIMSAFFYDIGAQKQELIKIIEKSKGAEFVNQLEDIALTGKQTVRSNSASFQQLYAPVVTEALKEFIF